MGAFGPMASIADNILPSLVNGTLDFNERILSIEMTETIDAQEVTSILKSWGVADGSQPFNLSKYSSMTRIQEFTLVLLVRLSEFNLPTVVIESLKLK